MSKQCLRMIFNFVYLSINLETLEDAFLEVNDKYRPSLIKRLHSSENTITLLKRIK